MSELATALLQVGVVALVVAGALFVINTSFRPFLASVSPAALAWAGGLVIGVSAVVRVL
jgi:hypothetical protein